MGRPKDEWNSNSYRRSQLRKKILPKGGKVLCWICREPGADQLDHKLPRSKYPELTWDESNIAPAHAECNNAKSDSMDPVGIGEPSEDW